MKHAEEALKKELLAKEEELLENDTRNDARKISELVEKDCLEISASGKQRIYKTGDLFGNVEGELYIMSNTVKLIDLSEDCKVLSYVAAKVNKNTRMKSNQSSIWKKAGGKWKMVFHQETNCSEP